MSEFSMQNIGIITDEISGDDPFAAMAHAARLGLGFVDFRVVYGERVHTLGQGRLRDLREKAVDLGLDVYTVYSTYGKCEIDKLAVDSELLKLYEAMRVAEELGSTHVRIFPGYYRMGREDDALAACASAVRIAEENGMTLLIEHEMVSMSRSAAFTRRVVDTYGSEHCRILFEPANLLIAEEDVLAGWALSREVCPCIHVKDAAHHKPGEIQNDDFHFAWTTVGDGEVPWMKLVDMLREENYADRFSLEPHCKVDEAKIGDRLEHAETCLRRLKLMLGLE